MAVAKSSQSQQVNRQQSWNPPPYGWFKVNVDATVKTKDQRVGLGVVTRDSNGKVVAATVQRAMFKNNIANMEAASVSLGIKTAQNAGYSAMVIESDSKEAVDLILNTKGSITEIS